MIIWTTKWLWGGWTGPGHRWEIGPFAHTCASVVANMSPAFQYAAQNYDVLGGSQRLAPRPMEMMSVAERNRINDMSQAMADQAAQQQAGQERSCLLACAKEKRYKRRRLWLWGSGSLAQLRFQHQGRVPLPTRAILLTVLQHLQSLRRSVSIQYQQLLLAVSI